MKKLIAPVRPSQKCDFPLIPIEEYVQWKNHEGKLFDPWIRVHCSSGGKILKACKRSMTISGSILDWENWTGLKFPGSGLFTVDGALVPIKIELKEDKGIYIEPNVWIIHDLI